MEDKDELTMDLSQSQQHCRARVNKYLSCITPGCHLFLPKLNRPILFEEKGVLMGFPMHHVDTGGNSAHEMHSMFGNTMHTRCVGAATGILLGMVDRRIFEQKLAGLRISSTSGSTSSEQPGSKRHRR